MEFGHMAAAAAQAFHQTAAVIDYIRHCAGTGSCQLPVKSVIV